MPTYVERTPAVSGTSPFGPQMFGSVSEWLAWVRSLDINKNATPADLRQISCAADRSVVPLIYGEDRVGGLIANVLPATFYGRDCAMIQVIWCHSCTSLDPTKMWLNDAVPDYSRVGVYSLNGEQTSTYASLVTAFAGFGITYSDTLEGFAYSVIWLPVADFTGQIKVVAQIKGRKVFDPRQAVAFGGVGSQVLGNYATYAWSDNPSLCLADFLYNGTYGAKKTVDWLSVKTAADENDTLVGGEKRRTLNVTFMQSQPVKSIVETLRAYAGVFLVPSPTGVKFIPDRPASSVYTYRHTEGKIAGIRRLEKRDIGNLPTVIELKYTDITQTPYTDGEVVISRPNVDVTVPRRLQQIAMPGINRYSQAYREAQERLNRIHNSDMSLTFDVFDIGIAHELGDVITVNHPLWNMDKLFRVADHSYAGDGKWTIAAEEYDPASYNDSVNTVPTYPDAGFTDPTLIPATPAVPSYSFSANGVELQWTRNAELTVTEYELRYGGANWAAGVAMIGSLPTIVAGTTFTWPPQSVGTKRVWIKARTSVGVESTTAAYVDVVINAPTLQSLTPSFSGTDYQLDWTLAAISQPLKFYRVRRNGSLLTETNSTRFNAPVDWTGSGSVPFTVAAVDIAGNEGAALSVNVAVVVPTSVLNFQASAVMNTVMFYWAPPTTHSLPIYAFRMKKGATWAGGTSLGDKAGDQTFTTFNESESGDFTYWIAAVDSAGNEGPPSSITVKVTMPANFKLTQKWDSTFSGTKTSALLDGGVLYAPVDITKTFQQHFDTGNGSAWTTPQNQIDAGFPYYIEPSTASGAYVEIFSANAPVAASLITVVPTGGWIEAGSNGTVTPLIEIADNVGFTVNVRSLGNVWEAYAANFQYIRVTLTYASSSGNDVYALTALTVKLSLQTEIDSGYEAYNSAHWSAGVCTVPFVKPFADVDSIIVTPNTTARRYWAYAFTDSAYPANFEVRFWDVNGNLTPTDFSWQATGVV